MILKKRVFGLAVVLALGCVAGSGQAWAAEANAIVPLVVTGAEGLENFFTTSISFVNLSATTAEATLTAYSEGRAVALLEDGGKAVSEARVHLAAGEVTQRSLLPHLFPTESYPHAPDAWLEIKGFQPGQVAVSARVSHYFLDGNVGGASNKPDFLAAQQFIVSDATLDAVAPARNFMAVAAWDGEKDGDRHCLPLVLSAYALVNPSEETAEVTARFAYSDGAPVLEVTAQIPPRTRISRFLSWFFPTLFPLDRREPCSGDLAHTLGKLELNSSVPIAVSAFSVNLTTGHFVDLPAAASTPREGAGVQ